MKHSNRRDPMAPIEVVSVSSTGLPARHPSVDEQRAQSMLYKCVSKLSTTGDLLAFANDVFSCGWPDVTVKFRRQDASTSDTHVWTLHPPQPDHASQDRGADHAA